MIPAPLAGSSAPEPEIQLDLLGQLADVSVVVPVFQCAARLPGHLRMLRELAPLVRRVIWVVTQGSDNSHQLARKAALETGGQYLEVPPGLYSAWNEGIRRVETPYLYISTVGENISLAGLRAMRDLLNTRQADLCFSPPVILPANRQTVQRTHHWPVFHYRRILARFDGQLVPIPVLARLQLLSGMSCVLGSCASTLFRRRVLADSPFPADFHYYGDTAWFYKNLTHLRAVFTPDLFSTFYVHDFSSRPVIQRDLHRCVFFLAEEYERAGFGSRLPRQARDLQKAREHLDHLREPHPFRFWWMVPSAWFWRLRRDWLRLKIWIGLLIDVFTSRARGADR